MRVEEANAVDLSIQIGLFVKVPRPGLTQVTIGNFSEGGDGTSSHCAIGSKIEESQISRELDATDLLTFDFDDTCIPETFHQTTGKGESSVGDAPIWVFSAVARR